VSCSRSIRSSSTHYFRHRGFVNRAFLLLDRIGRMIDPLVPRALRARAIRRAEDWINARANGEDGLGRHLPGDGQCAAK
jgi:squalene-hopene/tetraprenyl-beta-curcumene cyclase